MTSVAPGTSAVPTGAGASPLPGPSSTTGAGSALADGSIATVTVKALNLREGPSTSTVIAKTLKQGVRLFVIGEAQVKQDLRWHHVAVVPEEDCSGDCRGLGWVATPASGAETWIETSAVACSGSPVEAEELGKLGPLEQLHCYGDQDFTVTGWIDTPCCSGITPFIYSPAWLAAEPGAFFHQRPDQEGGGFISVRFAADARLPDTTVIMRATAHFDDPASSTCSASIAPDVDLDEVDEDSIPSRDEMMLDCRTNLVITAYEVVGYLPGLGCGCLPPSPEPAA